MLSRALLVVKIQYLSRCFLSLCSLCGSKICLVAFSRSVCVDSPRSVWLLSIAVLLVLILYLSRCFLALFCCAHPISVLLLSCTALIKVLSRCHIRQCVRKLLRTLSLTPFQPPSWRFFVTGHHRHRVPQYPHRPARSGVREPDGRNNRLLSHEQGIHDNRNRIAPTQGVAQANLQGNGL